MSDLDDTTLEQSCSEEKVEIISQDEDLWEVRICFPAPFISDREMIARMREAKNLISRRFYVPAERLEFRELLEKSPIKEGFVARVLIGRTKVGQGKPVVRLKPVQTARGEVFDDMIAELDFYSLDEFDQPISLERIRVEITRQGVDFDLCDIDAIKKAIEDVRERQSFIKGMVIARGKLPDIGRDAELEYTFFADPNAAQDLAEYRIGRKVKERDIICQKIEATVGKEKGYDVRGTSISPIRGLDFELVAGEGAKLSIDGTTITALRNGLPIMSRTMRSIYTLSGEKTIPEIIEVKVKPIVELNAEDIVNIVLDDSVEIIGDLKEGSTVTTRGEVFIEGRLAKGANIIAGENVMVNGEIEGGEISSDSSVYASHSVKDSRILAGDDVQLSGLVSNSEISGRTVKSGRIRGSKVEAGRKVFVQEAGNDAVGHKTTIRVGRDDFYRRKLESSKEVVERLKQNVEHIRKVFGDDVILRLTGGNHQQLLVEFMKKLRARGYPELDEETIESLRRLLTSIAPLKEVLVEKNEEIETLQKKASDESASKPIVVIREKIQDPVDVTINDKTQTIEPGEGAAITATSDGEIKTYKLPAPSSKKRTSR